jgi:3-oxoacyl-(acyl-carrier-protein) synthase/acyl carrier protein
MTTKEIIAAFRSGQILEEEAVARLTSVYRGKSASGVKAEGSSQAEGSDLPRGGFGNSQTALARPVPNSSQVQVVDTGASGLALSGRSPTPEKDSGTAPVCDIAVIGMSGRFPDAADVEHFWRNLTAGRDSVREVPKSRWNSEKYYDPNPAAPGKSYSKWAGLLEDIEYFDPLFFNISPLEAQFMDPQQRLFLQEAWRAFEDAGYAPNALSGTRCGVFVGVSAGDYQYLLMEAGMGTDAYVLLGNIIPFLPGRIGYALNLKGPSIAIDTASSSSLVAFHHACQSIRIGESDMALAGGVAVLATPYGHILTAKTGALSRTGKCHTFDQSADGFVPSEAVAAIVLKPLHKALQDGDHIYGVIKGSGVNQDGSTNGITAPSSESQKSLQLRVYRECGVDPSTVTYVECHGTGTKLGDPIEIAALTESFRAYTSEKQFCALGSSKTNVGHALAACGIVGLIKLLRCLERRQIPASLHFNTPNEHIAFSESPFYVNTTLRSWEVPPNLPRRAVINSFGISGTNAHVVLEEFIPPVGLEDEAGVVPDEYVAVPISARSELQLQQYARKMLEHFETASLQPDQKASSNDTRAELRKLQQIAYTMQTGRIALAHRLVMIVRSWQELKTELQAFVNGGSYGPNTWAGNANAPNDKRELNGTTLDPEKPAAPERLVSMAKSWVLGRDADWNSLYATARPRRISLPTYPFARERYWVPVRESGVQQSRLSDAVSSVPATDSSNSNKDAELPQAAVPLASHQDSPNAPSMIFLQEKSKSGEAKADIDWVGEVEKHRGEKLLFLYQCEVDLDAFTHLLRQFEVALNTPQVFQCSYIKLLERSSSSNTVPPTTGSSIALDDPAQVRIFLQSFEKSGNVPDALFFVPAPGSTGEEKRTTDAFFVRIVQNLLGHASSHSIAGYYCYEPTGGLSEFYSEAVAAEVNALEFGNANHSYRWVKVPAATEGSQKVATLMRERLAYPSRKSTELVDYRNERRTIRLWERVEDPKDADKGSLLRSGATYCITGNAGDLGLSLCAELSRRYQANIVLVPQTPLSPKESAELATLQQSGAKIHYVSNRGHESQLLKERLVKAVGSIREIRGVIDLGQVLEKQRRNDGAPGFRHSSMSMVEKDWKLKPLVNSNTAKLKGKCVILVNASSAGIVGSRFEQSFEGKNLMVAGEDVNASNVMIVNWTDLALGKKAAQRVLSEIGEIDYVLDFSDLYTEPRSRDASPYGRIGFCQELIARYRDLTVLYFTRGLQGFQSEWTTLAGSRRAGLMRMLSAEYNHVRAKCIDVDSEFLAPSSLPSKVTAEALAAVEETEICYRRGQRFAPYLQSRRLAEGTDSSKPQFSVRPGGGYVISGGTNGIGLEIAAYLAAAGAKKLALMGITPLPPPEQWRSALKANEISVYVRRKLEKLLEIQSRGVDLDIYSGRLIEREKLASFFSAFRSKAGRIDGVVHSAGCAPDLSNGRFAFIHKNQDDLQRIFEPKVDGLEALHEVLNGDTPDFFVTFSSMAAMVPRFGKGISDYAAANAFADDFVSYQVGQGRKYFRSMAWVGWSDVGLHRSEAAAGPAEQMERRAGEVGLLFNSSQKGIDLFIAGLRDAGQRSHRMPCLLDESAFHNACDTLLWVKANAPSVNNAPQSADLDSYSGNPDDLSYLSAVDEITEQAPLDFFVLLSPLRAEATEGRRQAYQNGFRSAFATFRNGLVALGKRKGATLALQAGPWKGDNPAPNCESPLESLQSGAALKLVEVALAQGGSAIVASGLRSGARAEDAASVLEGIVAVRHAASTTGQRPASEAVFEQVLSKLKNADREAREQILLEVNLDGFSDSQVEILYALVFEKTKGSDTEAAQVMSSNGKKSEAPSVSLREIRSVIDAELKNVLRLENATVSENGSFQQYGLDSISGMQLVSRLEKMLGLEVPPSWLIDYSTIETLSGKIVETQKSALPSDGKQSEEQGVSLREIRAVIDAELKNVLRLENATVSENGSFQQYGLDSISGMQLVSRLEKTLGLEVPPSWLIDYSTIETLSGKIVQMQKSAMASPAR